MFSPVMDRRVSVLMLLVLSCVQAGIACLSQYVMSGQSLRQWHASSNCIVVTLCPRRVVESDDTRGDAMLK